MSVCTQCGKDLIAEKDGDIFTLEYSRMLHQPEELTQMDVHLSCCCTYRKSDRHRCAPQLVYTNTHIYQSFVRRTQVLRVFST